MSGTLEPPPLVLHLIRQRDIGGLDSGLINLIRHMPRHRYRHAIVCLQDDAGETSAASTNGVEVISLHKGAGHDFGHYLRMFKVLRTLRPDLIHTCNLPAFEAQLLAAMAGIKLRVHAENGRDRPERFGARLKHQLLERLLRPLIGQFIAVDAELERWLIESVGAEPERVSQISNGVDSVEFHPRLGPPAAVGPPGFMQHDAFVIGAIGPMTEAAGCDTLVDTFLRLSGAPDPVLRRLRLLIVGDGPARAACLDKLAHAGAGQRAWLPGLRDDNARLLRAMDLFVQPAPVDGGASAILEAMASGLPVIAPAVHPNTELIHAGLTGILLPPASPNLLASALADYCRMPEMAIRHGARARHLVIAHHSMPAMARRYLAVYDKLTCALAPSNGP
jgi:sugar transferase (PEP-CTERM/EpsH1 system associated)